MTKNLDYPESIGVFLRNERERRGFTLEQVASSTKIGLRILENLEAGKYLELPAMPFVKGFIRNYCQFLGLSSGKVLEMYEGYLQQKVLDRPDRGKGHQGYVFERPEGEQARKILFSVMGALGVFGLLVLAVFKPSLKHRQRKHVDQIAVTQTQTQAPSVTPETADHASKPEQSTEKASPVAVTPTSTSATTQVPSVAVLRPPSITPTTTPTSSAVVVQPLAPSTPPVAKPAPTPTLVTQSPKPAPVVTSAVAPVVTPAVAPASTEADPLQSGLDLKPSEIKHKIVIEALADVWVRYRCDAKEPKRFALKKGRLLVLRGKDAVRFQASNPKSVKVRGGGASPRLMSEINGKVIYAGTETLVWPKEKSVSLSQEFNVEGKLPETAAPDEVPVTANPLR